MAKNNFLGLTAGPFVGVCPHAAHRLHVLKQGKRKAETDVLDIGVRMHLAPLQLSDEILRNHGFHLLTLAAAGGDQLSLDDLVEEESAATKKVYACADGFTWRAQDGGRKELTGDAYDSDDLVLLIDDMEILPHHGITLKAIIPDENKATNRPTAQVELSVKGCSTELFGSVLWREYTDSNPFTIKLAVKKSEHYQLQEQAVEAAMAKAPEVEEPVKNENQTELGEDGEPVKRKRGRPKKEATA